MRIYLAGPMRAHAFTFRSETVNDEDGLVCNFWRAIERVRAWCVANGDNPKNRIVLAGFDSEHGTLGDAGWTEIEWFRKGFLRGGMAQQKAAGHQQGRERLWLSPHCLRPSASPPRQTKIALEKWRTASHFPQ